MVPISLMMLAAGAVLTYRVQRWRSLGRVPKEGMSAFAYFWIYISGPAAVAVFCAIALVGLALQQEWIRFPR